MIGGGLAALPNALAEGLPHAPASATPVIALALLAFAGTVGPFALFAYGQSRVAPELAGTFLNLEPLVGTAAGALAFGDPFGPLQLLGGAVILAGIALSTTPRSGGPRTSAGASRTPRRRVAASVRARRRSKLRAMHGLLQIHVAHATHAAAPPSCSLSGVRLTAPEDARHLPPAAQQKREPTYQAAPLNTLSHHDPPRPPTRPHPDSPHLCGPGGSRAPLP